jgi:hypothetical protein
LRISDATSHRARRHLRDSWCHPSSLRNATASGRTGFLPEAVFASCPRQHTMGRPSCIGFEQGRRLGTAREQRRCVRVAIKEKPRFAIPRLLRFCATLPVANCHGNAPVMPKPGVILILRGARPSFAGLTRLSFMRWSAGRRAYFSRKARRLLAATSNLFATREKCCHDMLRRNIIVRRGRFDPIISARHCQIGAIVCASVVWPSR